MESESLAVAVVTAVSGVALEFLRRGVKQLAQARTSAAATLKQIADGQRAESSRALDAIVAQAKAMAELAAEIRELRDQLQSAVDARQRDDASLTAQLKDLEARVEQVAVRMAAYDEFRKHPVYRTRRDDDT